jgi:hypothetical protein
MSRFLWLIIGAIGTALLISDRESDTECLPEPEQTDSDSGDEIEAGYEIVESTTNGENRSPERAAAHQAVVEGTRQHATESVYETLIREAIHHRDKWQTKFPQQVPSTFQRTDSDAKEAISNVEQDGFVDPAVVARLKEIKRDVAKYHNKIFSTAPSLHCPHCRRHADSNWWYCSYCDTGQSRTVCRKCRCCEKRPTALVCPECKVPIPLVFSPEQVEWMMPAVPNCLVGTSWGTATTTTTSTSTSESKKHESSQQGDEDESCGADTEAEGMTDDRVESIVYEVETYLELRRRLETLYIEEEERLADKHGKGSQAYEDGMHQLDAFLQNLERRFREHRRDLIDDTNTETL